MPVITPSNLSRPQRNAPRGRLEYDVPIFGGLDATTDPVGLEELMSPDCLNVVYDTIKSVASRPGYTKVLTTKLSSFIGGMYPYYKSDGTKQLVYQANQNWYKYNNAGGSTVITGTPANFTANQQWDLDEYQDTIYGGNSVDGLIAYNGSAYSVANSGITPQFVKIHKNRVYCANKQSSTLYFSDAGSPTSFPVNNFILINTSDGQNITGIDDILDNLVIFKDDSVWILTGEPLGSGNTTTIGNLQLRQANSPVGCSAFRTICKVEQTLFFAHYSGLYALQNYSVTLISPALNAIFQDSMNSAFIHLAWGVYNDQEKKYMVGYPSTTSVVPDRAIVYHLLPNEYAIWDHIPGGCAANYRFSGLTKAIVIGDPSMGNIYELFQGNSDIYGDNGTALAAGAGSLTDSTKAWTVNALTDARIKIVSGTGAGSVATVLSNTSTVVTIDAWSGTTPAANSVYTIGYFDSYWKTKIFDFGMPGYVKKYRYLNMFIDSANYPIRVGISLDFQPLVFQKDINLTSSAPIWGSFIWGAVNWGSASSEFAQVNVGSSGHYFQAMFGNDKAEQPWRVIRYSISYKLKKVRPNIVTT